VVLIRVGSGTIILVENIGISNVLPIFSLKKYCDITHYSDVVFMQLLNILCKLAQSYISETLLAMFLVDVIFAITSMKYGHMLQT